MASYCFARRVSVCHLSAVTSFSVDEGRRGDARALQSSIFIMRRKRRGGGVAAKGASSVVACCRVRASARASSCAIAAILTSFANAHTKIKRHLIFLRASVLRHRCASALRTHNAPSIDAWALFPRLLTNAAAHFCRVCVRRAASRSKRARGTSPGDLCHRAYRLRWAKL